jgi:hypothetical protein
MANACRAGGFLANRAHRTVSSAAFTATPVVSNGIPRSPAHAQTAAEHHFGSPDRLRV